MTDLNVKKEYLNLIYADCGKGSAGEKIKELVTVPGTQYLIFGVILGVFPLLAQLGILTSSFVFAMGNTMIYAIMAIGFCLLMGYSGLASLGTAGFVGIGAYIAYYFMQVYGAPFGIAFIVTVMISLFSGVLVGFISLRIEGIYLAILTLGLSEILRNTFISLKSSIKLDMSKVRLFGVKIGEEQVYLLILALFVLLLFITSNLIRSPIGRALLSVKNSTSAAQAMGINLMKYRVLAFVISTVYAAIAGHRQFTAGILSQALHLPTLKKQERIIREKALRVLEFMGLTEYRDWYAAGLPYGILKKIEIARTLMCDPQLIILDEPAAGLNDTETLELAELIRRIRDTMGCTILLVEHDMGLVMNICQTVCAISFGKLLAIGTPEEIQKDPQVQKAYLGESDEEVEK